MELSYSSHDPELTTWQKLGCFIYVLFGLLAILFAGFLGIFGGCPAFAPPRCEPLSKNFYDAIFPVTLLVVIGGAFGLLRFFKRERN